MSCFSLATFRTLSLSLAFLKLIMVHVDLFELILLGLLSFLNVYVNVFHQFGEGFDHNFLKNL